jgi:hypothetical protein
MSGRLLDCSRGLNEEKGQRCDLRQWAHLRVAAGCAVKRKMLAREGAAVRKVAILNDGGGRGGS